MCSSNKVAEFRRGQASAPRRKGSKLAELPSVRGRVSKPLRIFVYEYICGGGFAGQDMPDSLRTEGFAMLNSVVTDFAAIQGVHVCCTLDHRLDTLETAAQVVTVSTHNASVAFDTLCHQSDFCLIIAPEMDGILAERSRRADQCGTVRIGPTFKALQTTANKLLLADHLLGRQVPTAIGKPLDATADLSKFENWPAVIKPVDGAGCQDTFIVQSPEDAAVAIVESARCHDNRHFMLQPYYPGRSVSVSFLAGPASAVPLQPCLQQLSPGRQLSYLGGETPIDSDVALRAIALAQQALASLPGLLGYVNVDLVIGATAAEDVIMEINPRVSTSYVGLRAVAKNNLAEVLLDLWRGSSSGEILWDRRHVRFSANGQVNSLASGTAQR